MTGGGVRCYRAGGSREPGCSCWCSRVVISDKFVFKLQKFSCGTREGMFSVVLVRAEGISPALTFQDVFASPQFTHNLA